MRSRVSQRTSERVCLRPLLYRMAARDNWSELVLYGVHPTGKEIGRGAYGRVFEVDYEGTLCAAKEVHELLLQYAQGDEYRKITDDFLRECLIWSTLRHPCIVQFLGVFVCQGVSPDCACVCVFVDFLETIVMTKYVTSHHTHSSYINYCL